MCGVGGCGHMVRRPLVTVSRKAGGVTKRTCNGGY